MDTFVGDGCTLWLDGLGPYDWRHCCDIHDFAYYLLAPKLDADLALAACVIEAGGPILGTIMATLMFAGLTLFGWAWYEKAKTSVQGERASQSHSSGNRSKPPPSSET